MKDHEIMDLLIESNNNLSASNERLTYANTKIVQLLDKITHENEQLYQLCSEIQQWLLDKQHPTKKERYWIERIQKTFIKRGNSLFLILKK